MYKFLTIFFLTIPFYNFSQQIAGGKINVYFNTPVNTAVSTGVNAIYLNNTLDDTLVAYINRAKFSLDIAVYDYVQTSYFADISVAVNAAYSRGVKVRWIHDGAAPNTSLPLINSNIKKLASPTTSFYGIMHNKFVVIDANSSNANDPIVWTGSTNWKEEMFKSDVNNVVIIQDKPLAQAYLTEFNEMWGDTGVNFNLTKSKFGPQKSNNTPHHFTVGGINLDLYFSPTDSVSEHIIQEITKADAQLFFGIYTFTDSLIAQSMKDAKVNRNIHTLGIMDNFSKNYTPFSMLNPVMNSSLIVYNQSNSIYHSKNLIIDALLPASADPVVITGSHNWSKSANTKNDENTLIFHSPTIANVYYQSFYQNFSSLGGGTLLGLENQEEVKIFFIPVLDLIQINGLDKETIFSIYNLSGSEIQTGYTIGEISLKSLSVGNYILKIGNEHKLFCKF